MPLRPRILWTLVFIISLPTLCVGWLVIGILLGPTAVASFLIAMGQAYIQYEQEANRRPGENPERLPSGDPSSTTEEHKG